MNPTNFGIRQWYKGAVAASAALLGLGAVGNQPALILFGLGLLLLGLGEWINHPFISQIIPPGMGMPAGIASGEVRRPKLFGLSLAGVGLILMAAGLWRLTMPILFPPHG